MLSRKRLVIFFIPANKIVNGGVLSIFDLCKNSRKYSYIHKSEVILCTYPSHRSYKTNDLFQNSELIYSFQEVMDLGPLEYLQLHIPEYASSYIFNAIDKNYLKSVKELRVNILDQNILMMEDPLDVANWFSLTPFVSQTTAHDRYTTQENADLYNLPTHNFSTYLDPLQYRKVHFDEKENIVLISPDKNELKNKLVNKIKREIPELKIITVKRMSYFEFKRLIARAKFCITFGEGFDGYFLETFFSGGITFAVYNDVFFPDVTFLKHNNVYPDYSAMLMSVVKDMKELNNAVKFEALVAKNNELIGRYYSFKSYLQKIKNFYLKKFDYLPSSGSAERLIGRIAEQRNELIAKDKSIIDNLIIDVEQKSNQIQGIKENLRQKDDTIASILSSRSWRITSPLRKFRVK